MSLATYIKRFDYRLWILACGWVASAMGFAIAIPFISLYFHSELGMSLTSIGLFLGVNAIIRSLFQALGGELADRLGRYHLMVIGQLARSVIFLAMAVAVYQNRGFYPLGGLLILNSIFGAMFQPAANATVADLVGIENRTEGYSIVRVAGNFGWAIGPAIGGYLSEHSWGLLFIIAGVMTFLSGSIIAILLRGIKSIKKAVVEAAVTGVAAANNRMLLIKYTSLIFIMYLAASQFITPFSLYAVDFVGISKTDLGYLFTLNGLMVVLFQMPTTSALRKTRLTLQMALGSVIYAVGFMLVGLTSTFIAFAAAMVVITTAELFVSPPALAITANMAPKGRIGRYMGIYGFAVTAGWSLGPLLGCILLDYFKPNFINFWSIIGVLALAAALGYYKLTSRIPAAMNIRRETSKL